MRHYFVISTILLLISSVQFSLGQLEEENSKTESKDSAKNQKGRSQKTKETLLRNRKKVANNSQIKAVVVQLGVVPSTGSEMLLRKNNEKCVENLSDA